MASTNSHHHASIRAADIVGRAQTRANRRAAAKKGKLVGNGSIRKRARASKTIEGGSVGWPSFESLKPSFLFLCLPLIVVILMIVMGGLPKPLLYLCGLVIGIVVAMSTFKTAELTVVCILLYLPFAKTFVIPVLPGLNGTNMLIMLAIGTAVMQASREKIKFVIWPPGSKLVIAFAVYTGLSAFTILQHPGGGFLLKQEILSYKSWLDQFIIYWLLVAMIRDKDSAKRAVVYLLIGSMAVVIYTIPEMLEKMGRSSIEKSRMVGPQMQSNNFGGFVAYSLLPFIAFLMVYIKDIRAWMVTPYFLLAFKVLISTFSRGAYLAIAAGGLVAGYYRGRVFLTTFAVVFVSVVAVFPAVIPQSISARMGNLIGGESAMAEPEEDKLDKSSSTRIIMWDAAGQMMLESPILGKGFKGFPFLKSQYTKEQVKESDPHSMYFYIGSQMGIPALVMFFMIMGYMFQLGRFHARNKEDMFIRAVGIAGTGIPVCYAVICIFGSRATALNFTIYFWAYLIVLQVFKHASNQEKLTVASEGGGTGRGKMRTFDKTVRLKGVQDASGNPQLEIDTPRKSRASQRLPKRGAAAFLAEEAERKMLEAKAEIEALRAQRLSGPTSMALQTATNVPPQPLEYETRAARRAREANEAASAQASSQVPGKRKRRR